MTLRRTSAFLLLLGALAGCPSTPPATQPESRQPSARTRWLPVRPASSAAPTEAPAKVLLSPEGAAVVVAGLPARILKIWVRAGDQVQAGAPLLDVYIPEAMSALAAKAAAATSIAVLERRRAQLASLESEGLVKASEVAALAIELAKYQGEALRADATLQSVQVSSAGPTRIQAPIAGIVTEVTAVKGELRSPSDGPLVRLRANVGGRVEVKSPTPLDERGLFSFRASGSTSEVPLRLVSSVPNTSGAGSIAWLEGPDNQLKAGAMGVLLTRRANDNGFVVPTSAIASDEEGTRILVRRRDGDPRVVPVKVLHVVSTDAIVEGALSTDDLVASDAFVLPPRDAGGSGS